MGRKTAQSAQPTPLPIGKSLFYLTDRCSKKEADDGNGRRALGVGEAVCSLTSTSGSATSGASRDPSPPSPTGHRTAFGLEVAAGLAKKKTTFPGPERTRVAGVELALDVELEFESESACP